MSSFAASSNQLKRRLGFWDSIAINVGVIIGVGIFRVPGDVATFLDSSWMILLAWLVGGLISLLGVFCYAELSSRFPETGGTYVYLKEGYGKWMGFLFGWTEFLIVRAASIAGVAYIFTSYLQHFIPFPDAAEKWMTMGMIILFTLINIFGLHTGTNVQKALSLLKIIAIFAMTAVIFVFAGKPVFSFFGSGSSSSSSLWMGFAPALIPVLWAYGGWHQSTFMSGEFHDTKKALPISLVASALIVAGIYILMNAAYLQVVTPEGMTQTKAIASDIFMRLFGESGMLVVTAAILISASGALNSTILTGGRIPFAVACDYPKFSWLAKVDERFGTPMRSLVLNSLWACVLVLWGNFETLLFFFAFANWLFFALVGISVFIHRRQMPLTDHHFEMMGYPWVPAIFTFVSFWLCWTTVQHAPHAALTGAVLILAGLPVYYFCRGNAVTPKAVLEL